MATGVLDLAVAGIGRHGAQGALGGSSRCLLGNGDGTFCAGSLVRPGVARPRLALVPWATSTATATSTSPSPGSVRTVRARSSQIPGRGMGPLAGSDEFLTIPGSLVPTFALAGDFDGDGRTDLLLVGDGPAHEHVAEVWLGQGAALFVASSCRSIWGTFSLRGRPGRRLRRRRPRRPGTRRRGLALRSEPGPGPGRFRGWLVRGRAADRPGRPPPDLARSEDFDGEGHTDLAVAGAEFARPVACVEVLSGNGARDVQSGAWSIAVEAAGGAPRS